MAEIPEKLGGKKSIIFRNKSLSASSKISYKTAVDERQLNLPLNDN